MIGNLGLMPRHLDACSLQALRCIKPWHILRFRTFGSKSLIPDGPNRNGGNWNPFQHTITICLQNLKDLKGREAMGSTCLFATNTHRHLPSPAVTEPGAVPPRRRSTSVCTEVPGSYRRMEESL